MAFILKAIFPIMAFDHKWTLYAVRFRTQNTNLNTYSFRTVSLELGLGCISYNNVYRVWAFSVPTRYGPIAEYSKRFFPLKFELKVNRKEDKTLYKKAMAARLSI